MTRDHPAGANVEMRPVEWVRHLADQPMHRVAWQPRISVECDDIADAGGHLRRLPANRQKAGVGRATQQPVQFMQLAAFAFPADPSCLARVPEPFAVKQQEAIASWRRAVATIEPGNPGNRCVQQRFIAFDMLCRGIEPVGEQSEMQLAFRACEVVDLQTLNLFLDRRFRRQQRWYHDQSAQMRGHAAAEFQSGQRHCAEAVRHTAVHHRHCRIDGRHQPQNTKQAEPHRAETMTMQYEQGYGDEDNSHNSPGADIAADAEPAAQASEPRTWWYAEADGRLECAATASE